MTIAIPAAAATAGVALVVLLLAGGAIWMRRLAVHLRATTRELHELDERHRFQAHVLAQVTDAIVVTDRHGRIRTWNSGAETLFARTSALRRADGEIAHVPSLLVRCLAALPVELAA